MSYLDNYKAFAAGLVKGLRIFKNGYYGQRLIGTVGLVADMVAEGSRQAFIARLPGHPEQSEDSALQVGVDRQLTRFKYEPLLNYKDRLRNAWTTYAQRGTNIGLKAELDYCVSCIWTPNGIFAGITTAMTRAFEQGWADHLTVLTSPGQGSVNGAWSTVAESYGSFNYSNNKWWGISNVLLEDMNAIKKVIRDALPSRTKGFLAWNNLSIFYGSTNTYGGGSNYSATSATVFKISVE